MDTPQNQKDSPAWIAFVWISFVLSSGMMILGVWFLPVDAWVKGYFAMGFFFTMGSSFSLSKTLRDQHESRRLINRIVDAKTEKILNDYEMKKAV
ncbi:MAG: YiaA/YiaB family inner membrane protein [Chloroflexales bacterium]